MKIEVVVGLVLLQLFHLLILDRNINDFWPKHNGLLLFLLGALKGLGLLVGAVVGLLLGVLAFREDLPLTMKSCFYPLIGDCIFGWIGDVIDVISILATLFGVCTSLGIAARQVNMGLYVVFPSVDSENTTIQVGSNDY